VTTRLGERPQDVAEAALAAAGDFDGQTVVIVENAYSEHVRWARNTVISNGATGERRTTVIALAPGRTPGVVAQRGPLDARALAGLVGAAERALGRAAGPEEHPPPLPRPGRGPDDDWHRPPAGVPGAGLPAFGERLAAGFARATVDGLLLYGFAEHRVRTTYLASSTGVLLRHQQSEALLDHTVRTGGDTASTWTGTHAADLDGLDLDEAYEAARQRLRQERPVRAVPPGTEVLLSPSCVADLMIHLYAAAAAQDAREGRTVLAAPGGGTRINERLSPLPLNLHSDPREPGLPCAPFVVTHGTARSSVYDNGLPLSRTTWMRDGVLTALVQSRHAAAAAGERATPEIGNLVLSGGSDDTLAEMIARTRCALLITALWYVRVVDPARLLLTGLTRDGVYLIEDGQVRGAVDDHRFHVSPLDVLAHVREAGRTVPALNREYGGQEIRTAMPPLRVGHPGWTSVRDAA
jgi:predicted Zn-dependent protease